VFPVRYDMNIYIYIYIYICYEEESRPSLWSSGQSSCLQIQRSRTRFPALPDFPEK
jgi:hypothetical protein